jgi:hypothetical protein
LAEEHGVPSDVLSHIECRATLCRLEIALGDPLVISNLPRVAAQLGSRYWMQRKPGDQPALDVILERASRNAAL